MLLAYCATHGSLWNGVDVVEYTHVSGRGGPQNLNGAWSEPLNKKANTLCSLNADAPRLECPVACSLTHTVRRRRLRKAIHAMSEAEWQRVVDALWVLRTTKNAEGIRRFGPDYRDIDFHLLRHVLGTLPGRDRLQRHEVDRPPMDVTGGAAHTFTWHALFTLEVETSLLVVDPLIDGLPYMDWGAMRDPDVAEVYRKRLGVGAAQLAPSALADLGDMGSQDVLMAWAKYKKTHGGETMCRSSALHLCEPRLLADGSFANWPVPTFDWREWYDGASPAVQKLFAHVNASTSSIVAPLVHRGQLRCNASGASVHRHPVDGHSDDATPSSIATLARLPAVVREAVLADRPPIDNVVRGDGAFEHIFVNRSEEWHAAAQTCVFGLDGGLYQDLSECIEGRMEVRVMAGRGRRATAAEWGVIEPTWCIRLLSHGPPKPPSTLPAPPPPPAPCVVVLLPDKSLSFVLQVNDFSIHFEAHFLGGDMGWAVIPHDPIFFFHHNGLDRLRMPVTT